MPNWKEILDEIKEKGSVHDIVRRKYLEQLHDVTGRNLIIYYSGWLQKPDLNNYNLSINDTDKTGFMSVVNKMDRSKGLDLLLHTPGGDIAATESIVDYLRAMFGNDIRIIIPQLAMSAGTMIACAGKKIVMGKQSSLGPIDPQFRGLPAHGLLEEFDQAFKEISEDEKKLAVWGPIISKYPPTILGECRKAIEWSTELVEKWLKKCMFSDEDESFAEQKIINIIKELSDHAVNLNHSRHISQEKAKEIGLKIIGLEEDDNLQDAVLSVHHAVIHTLTSTNAVKIIENQNQTAHIQSISSVILKT